MKIQITENAAMQYKNQSQCMGPHEATFNPDWFNILEALEGGTYSVQVALASGTQYLISEKLDGEEIMNIAIQSDYIEKIIEE